MARVEGDLYNRDVSRLRNYRTEAIILKRHDYGEADRILTLYTLTHGKIGAIAKGVRRLTSRVGGHVELLAHVEMVLHRGRNLDVVSQVDSRTPYRLLRQDLERLTYACHAAELVDRLTAEHEPNPRLFRRLRETLGALEAGADPALALRYFEMQLLANLGYQPELTQCVVCRDELAPDGNGFSADLGGVVCPECRPSTPRAPAIDGAVFRVLRFLQSRGWDDVGRMELSAATRRGLEAVLVPLLHHVVERELRSVELLRSLRRVGAAPAGAVAPAASTE
jgi:DNA repair protein RecO (recombination protein O)